MRASRTLAAFVAVIAGAGLLVAAPTASAAQQPTTYAAVQARVGFTVYQPTQTYGMRRTSFSLDRACDVPRGVLAASYSGPERMKAFLSEFAEPCGDIEVGWGPVASFRVFGSRVDVLARCANGREQCRSAPRSGLTDAGVALMTLPGAAGKASTSVVLGTEGMTLTEIRDFLVAMRAVAVQPDDPQSFAQVQRTAAYTVYLPADTFGLRRTLFMTQGCVTLARGMLVAYGTESGSSPRSLSLTESSGPCGEGPDGIGPATTITVAGSPVMLMGACAGETSLCDSAPVSGVLTLGYLEAVLPAAGDHGPTRVEMYAQGLTVEQIEYFLNAMRPVG